MKRRFDWCDPACREIYQGTPYQMTVFSCANVHVDYGMTWLPTFCPACGGKLVEDAKRRYRDARKPKRQEGDR
jgi:hypothetical protein